MDFGQLKSSLLEFLGRAPKDLVYQLVTADLNNRLRTQEMLATITLAEAGAVDLPADFLSLSSVHRDSTPRTILTPVSENALHSVYCGQGTPTSYAISNRKMLLDADGSSNLILTYYSQLADFSGDSDTNAVLSVYPQVYVYGSMYHHSTLIRDDAAQGYFALYEQAIKHAEASDSRNKYGGATPRPTVKRTP